MGRRKGSMASAENADLAPTFKTDPQLVHLRRTWSIQRSSRGIGNREHASAGKVNGFVRAHPRSYVFVVRSNVREGKKWFASFRSPSFLRSTLL